jgi:aryl sulfotransferase
MPPPAARDRIMRDAAMIREAVAVMQTISARLSAAGFDDFPENGMALLGALAMKATYGKREGDLLRELGITGQAATQLMNTLMECGYLEFQAPQDGSEGPGPVTTRRSSGALNVARDSVFAARWADFPFREGDIVISTLPKSGTTWVQMICALLIFLTPDLPAPLPDLSPWMDSLNSPRDEIYARLADLDYRRFIKTHMPLNEIPIRSGVTYIVVARHPLDVAISMFHQAEMEDGARRERSGGEPEPDRPRKFLLEWIDMNASPEAHRHSLPGAMRRLTYVWERRDEPNIVLLHYEDLSSDLEGEMRRLAARLGETVPVTAWPPLVRAATFEQMRATAGRLVEKDTKDPAAFFRRGTSGSARELLTNAELARYHARVAQLAPPDLLTWLHRGR